jgi:hypothetical protein
MIKLLPFILKNWKILFWVVFYVIIAFLGYKTYNGVYKTIAFSHNDVKTLVLSSAKCDSLVSVQSMQLSVFNDELNGCYLQIVDDSIRYYKAIAQHQINGKKLLNRATYAESLLNQYKGQGACRYQEDSIVGNWLNRKKFTVWRTRPCVN